MVADIFCVLILLLGGWIIFTNGWGMVMNAKYTREGIDKHVSFVPVLGPVLMMVGMGNLFEGLGWFLIVPWVIDPATLVLVYGAAWFVKQKMMGGGGAGDYDAGS